ncbi:MAG: thioesterase [Chitinophagales bacterium]|nr:thioesterase [Chitinophagales bacterium]
MKAILLHHAGGDKYAYRNMQQLLLPEIESIAFELPGRSDRFSEKFVQNLEAAVDDIYRQLIQQLPEEYCIIGNSMGSIMGFLLTHKLQEENKPLPKFLFLASRLSPDAYKDEPNIIGISSDDFWKVVQQYDGVPAQLLAHKELKEFYEPILRSDFELLQHFNETFENIEPINVPASILFGDKDVRNVSAEKMQGWRKFFTTDVDIQSFEGGHFFLYENEKVVDFIKQKVLQDN